MKRFVTIMAIVSALFIASAASAAKYERPFDPCDIATSLQNTLVLPFVGPIGLGVIPSDLVFSVNGTSAPDDLILDIPKEKKTWGEVKVIYKQEKPRGG